MTVVCQKFDLAKSIATFTMQEDTHYSVLKIIEENPRITQRELADDLGVSLGKANYCLKALVARGWVKAGNFKRNRNKLSYAYLLTPRGIEGKADLTVRFLKRKMNEYELLKKQIELLQKEMETR